MARPSRKQDPVWHKVARQVEKGKAPVIKLSSAARIVETKKPMGRPKGSGSTRLLRTLSGGRMTCRAAGCQEHVTLKAIKSGLTITCSAACEQDIRSECLLMLDILDGKVEPQDFPLYLRTNKNRRKRTL